MPTPAGHAAHLLSRMTGMQKAVFLAGFHLAAVDGSFVVIGQNHRAQKFATLAAVAGWPAEVATEGGLTPLECGSLDQVGVGTNLLCPPDAGCNDQGIETATERAAMTATSAEFFLYEHDKGSTIVARADDVRLVGNPAWHRVGPVDVHGDDVLRSDQKAA